MLFSLLDKHYLDLYISDTALKVSQSLYCFTTSICHGVENFPQAVGYGHLRCYFSNQCLDRDNLTPNPGSITPLKGIIVISVAVV